MEDDDQSQYKLNDGNEDGEDDEEIESVATSDIEYEDYINTDKTAEQNKSKSANVAKLKDFIPDSFSNTANLREHLVKAFIDNMPSKIDTTNIVSPLDLSNNSSAQNKHCSSDNFKVFQKGTIQLGNFTSIVLQITKADIAKGLMQERMILEFVLTMIGNMDDSKKLPLFDNLASWLNGLNSVFYKFGSCVTEKVLGNVQSQLSYFNISESFLSMFKDIRNTRKFFSKLFYGCTRKSIIKYFAERFDNDHFIVNQLKQLKDWSKYDCDSFQIDEDSYSQKILQENFEGKDCESPQY